jgi:hypothetical protein
MRVIRFVFFFKEIPFGERSASLHAKTRASRCGVMLGKAKAKRLMRLDDSDRGMPSNP